MMSLFLMTLCALLRTDVPPAALPFAAQQSLIQTMAGGGYQPRYHIVRALPPVRRSVFMQPAILVSASSGMVIDEYSGAVLWQRHPDEVLPIASLTKLTTALVFLNTDPDFNGEVTMAKSDETDPDGSRLQVAAGETLTVGDLFHASLIGSANNATRAMVRSTGLSEEEFISRMNTQAAQLGLTRTTFREVTGLDPANTSTVRDYARLAGYAFRNNRIQEALNRGEYVFSTINTRHAHRIRNTNKLLADSALHLVGAKTGYLDEAGFTFVAQTDSQGHRLTVVLFNSASSDQRFTEAKALIQWAEAAFIWL